MKHSYTIKTLLLTTLAGGQASLALANDLEFNRPYPGRPGGGWDEGRHSSSYDYEIRLVREAQYSVQRASSRDPRAFQTAAYKFQELEQRTYQIRFERERFQIMNLVRDTQNALYDRRASFDHKRARVQINGDQIISLLSRLNNVPGRPHPGRPGHEDVHAARFAESAYETLNQGIHFAGRLDFTNTLRALQKADQELSQIRVRNSEIESAKSKVRETIQRLNLVPNAGPLGHIAGRIALGKASEKMQDAQKNILKSGLLRRGGYNPRPW